MYSKYKYVYLLGFTTVVFFESRRKSRTFFCPFTNAWPFHYYFKLVILGFWEYSCKCFILKRFATDLNALLVLSFCIW